MEARELIFATAAVTPGVGPLAETLKWGEPAYLTMASRSGSTVRLGRVGDDPRGAVLFNCRTTLVGSFRAHFADALAFAGNRAILLDGSAPLPTSALSLCLRMALTYHRRDGRAGRARPGADAPGS
ncbi:hypothetical protein GCM10010994_18540 [Chelatococcus reniformis]|uniref:DUF1801 domain-containing protein n=2 Tax=Chelatococcus reniformis TaxID=1494448 RepID=A0A916U5T0_9HYPH|nr:hypothetical protein GCM10010994_18540 [Chelatococcus reniformis]